jgi:tetraacyldisaccharide 4'-kinase
VIRNPRLAAPKLWSTRGPAARLWLPLSWVYVALVRVRRACYAGGICRVVRFQKPVVVVGSIAVGGCGKTPLVMCVARLLASHGYKPGIASRGYGGRPSRVPLIVDRDTPVDECGDEPAMMSRNLELPIVVDPDRPRAVETLISKLGCEVVISDDGLQHYAMDRRVEIASIGDGRCLGNGYCLPAGPLREPRSRLREVDMVVYSGGPGYPGGYSMQTGLGALKSLAGNQVRSIGDLRSAQKVHAVAGTGNPEGFFSMLEDLGLVVETHPFPDHHPYAKRDFAGMEGGPIVMTEKDAVKCSGMSLDNTWYAPLEASLDESFEHKLIESLKPYD